MSLETDTIQRPQLVSDIYDELMARDTTALVLTGLDGLGKTTLANLVRDYAKGGDEDEGRFPGRVLISREIGEKPSFRDLTMDILQELGKPDQDLATGQQDSDLDGTIGSDRRQVSPAALLYGAIRAADPPVMLVLQRINHFVVVDEQSGIQTIDPEVGEWLRRLNEDCECKSRVLLTSSIKLTGLIFDTGSSTSPTVPMSGLDIATHPTVPMHGPASPTMPIGQTQNRDRLKPYSKLLGVTIDEAAEILKQGGWGSVPVEYRKKAARRCGAEEQRGTALAHVFKVLPKALAAYEITPKNLSDALDDPANAYLWTGFTMEKLFNNIWVKLSRDQQQVMQSLSAYRGPVEINAIKSLSTGGFTTQPVKILPSLISLCVVEKLEDPKELYPQYRLHPALKDNAYQTLTTGQEREQAHLNAAAHREQQAKTPPPSDKQDTFQSVFPTYEQAWHLCQIGEGGQALDALREKEIFLKLMRWGEPQLLSEACTAILDTPWLAQARPEDEGHLRGLRGQANTKMGRNREARADLNRKLDLSKQNQQDPLNLAEAYYDSAKNYQDMRRFDLAEEELKQALLIIETLTLVSKEAPRIEARVCQLFGDIFLEQEKFQDAKKYYARVLRIFDKSLMTGKEGRKAEIHCVLGDLCRKQYDRKQAIECYKEANKLYTQIKDMRGVAKTLNKIGKMLCEQGDFSGARNNHQQAYDLYEEETYSDKHGMADSCNYGGDACMLGSQKIIAAARECFEEALGLYIEKGIKIGEAESLNNMGRVCDAESGNNNPDKLDDALNYYEQALEQARKKWYKRLEGWILSNSGLVHQKKGDNKKAEDWFKLALDAHKVVRDLEARASTLYYYGQLYKMEAERLQQQGVDEQKYQPLFNEAANYYREALKLLREQKNWIVGVPAMYDRGDIKLKLASSRPIGVAYLLCAQEHDIKYCGSRYNNLIRLRIQSLKLEIGEPQYNKIERSFRSNPCKIVNDDLND